ncbi:DUF2249 domain-containing protein [Solitalea sp. MAHUQ-68]|uniref:DUF2249 domain-containing protein n=1 Tax=Solitalea agri TaxID=2953739 RepID=A0A9X2F399_9SPHI|nr:DUF2249 domain-containing protein [Solitalea agri]MCO4293942.1 DUF2249 domain-containing protein [Solitalea agri]
METENLVLLDVRPLLAQKQDPFKQIMETVNTLPTGSGLHLITPFEPVPLYVIMQSKGFVCRTERISNNEVHTYFEPESLAVKSHSNEPEINLDFNDETFTSLVNAFKGKLHEVDVRELEMPQPMLTILAELEHLPADHALLVHHKKVPLFLLPELKARDFEYLIYNKEKVELLIFR